MNRKTIVAGIAAFLATAIVSTSGAGAAPVSLAGAGIAVDSAANSAAVKKIHYRPYYHRHRWDPPYYDDDYDDYYWYFRPCYFDEYLGRRVCESDYGYNRRRARVRRSRRNRGRR